MVRKKARQSEKALAEIARAEETRKIVLEFYGRRCLVCKRATETVHEIHSRGARGRAAELDFNNRVPLCHLCHAKVHQEGTVIWQPKLKALQESFLKTNG